nr:phosphate uptake regulator PhoU [Candidatus Njordarchaeota archaeon]
MVEGRKVQRVGRATLSISLPTDWVKKVGLRKGDLVIFSQEKDGSIRLIPSAYVRRKTEGTQEGMVNSDLCDVPKMLERMIVAHYMLGRDTIVVISSGSIGESHLEEIRSAVRRLMGLGIVEEAPNRIALQCSIDHSKFPISTLIRRMHVTVSTMHNEVTQALREANRELAQSVTRRKNETDMIYSLIVRLLHGSQRDPSLGEQIGVTEPTQVQGYRLTATSLEKASNSCHEIATILLDTLSAGKKIPEDVATELARIGTKAMEIFNDAMQSFQSGDITVANKAIDLCETFKSQFTDDLIKGQPTYASDLAVHVRGIEYNIRKIVDASSAIAAVVLERTLEKVRK